MGDNKPIEMNLRNLIENSGKTRREIAKELGCDVSTVTKHYNENRNIRSDFIIKYANYFKVSTDYLLGRDDTPTNDKDLAFVCKYTGFKDDVIKSLMKNPADVKLLNDLLSDEKIDFFVLTMHIEAYKRKLQNLIDFMEQTINNKSKWKSEKDLETLFGKHRDLIDSYQLTEYQVQKTMVKLLENYCKNETDKIAELQNSFDEIIHELLIKYGETYDE